MKLASILLGSLLTFACGRSTPLSPLVIAAREGNTGRIAELVKSGADVNERAGVNAWTPLMHAVHTKQPASVRALIAAGADVNATAGIFNRDTALRLAEIQELNDIAILLRDHGARASK
jgi:ankyrin repeat protein